MLLQCVLLAMLSGLTVCAANANVYVVDTGDELPPLEELRTLDCQGVDVRNPLCLTDTHSPHVPDIKPVTRAECATTFGVVAAGDVHQPHSYTAEPSASRDPTAPTPGVVLGYPATDPKIESILSNAEQSATDQRQRYARIIKLLSDRLQNVTLTSAQAHGLSVTKATARLIAAHRLQYLLDNRPFDAEAITQAKSALDQAVQAEQRIKELADKVPASIDELRHALLVASTEAMLLNDEVATQSDYGVPLIQVPLEKIKQL